MTDAPILYSFRRCPYAMRARMALLVSGTACRVREVVLRDKPAEMIEISPKATVPVLQLADGNVIDESLAIMHWALARNDPEHWLAYDAAGLIAVNDGPFKHHLDRYKYAVRYKDADPVEHRTEALKLLKPLEARLKTGTHLLTAKRGLADIAIFPFVRQFAAADRDWFAAQPLPAVQKWLATLISSSLFKTAMTRWPQWQSGDPEPILHLG